MATTKGQRIGIWIIAAFMLVGTVGSFLMIVLANDNAQMDQARIEAATKKYQEDSTAYQAKVTAQNKELSSKYFESFNAYMSQPTAFNAEEAKELSTRDLQEGTGEVIGENATFTAYYVGWNPTGKVFDSSVQDGTLKAPITAAPGGVIEGWLKGAVGMKTGGVREITIPANLAYGETGSGEDIPANTPLKFIIMVIPTPEKLPEPEMPKELLQYYQSQGYGA